MRVLFLPESTSASVAILTRYPAGTLVRFTTVSIAHLSPISLSFCLPLSLRPYEHTHARVMHINVVNTLRPRQNGCHFPDDFFKWIFLNEYIWISKISSLKFVPKGTIHNVPALVQIMARCRTGDKPLFEPMMVSLLTHVCVTRPQWVNILLTVNICIIRIPLSITPSE